MWLRQIGTAMLVASTIRHVGVAARRRVAALTVALGVLAFPALAAAQPAASSCEGEECPEAAGGAALRVAMTWTGSANLDLVVVDPSGRPLDFATMRPGVQSGGDATNGETGEWLAWEDVAGGSYVICAVGEVGAESIVSVSVTIGGRAGLRTYPRSGRLGRPCVRGTRGFLLALEFPASGSAGTSPPPGAQTARGVGAEQRIEAGAQSTLYLRHAQNGHEEVTVTSSGQSRSCRTPCEVVIPRGEFTVNAGRARRELTANAAELVVSVDLGWGDPEYVVYISSHVAMYLCLAGALISNAVGLATSDYLSTLPTTFSLFGIAGGLGIWLLVANANNPDGLVSTPGRQNRASLSPGGLGISGRF